MVDQGVVLEGDQSSELQRCLIKGLCWKVCSNTLNSFHFILFSMGNVYSITI